MHCGDGTPFSHSLSIWEIYCIAWWKGPAAAYTCSRNLSQEARHSSSFSYEWLGSWRKYFGVMVVVGTTVALWWLWILETTHLLLGWVNPLDLPLALHEKQCDLLVAFMLPCGPDKLSGQEDPSMSSKVSALHSDLPCWPQKWSNKEALVWCYCLRKDEGRDICW